MSARQLRLPIEVMPPEELMRDAHRRSLLRVSFERAMANPAMVICLRNLAASRAGRCRRRQSRGGQS